MAKGAKTGGRTKGTPNRATASVKEAITSVFAMLQEDTGEELGHFKEWALDNPTDFYKLAAKLIPVDVNHAGNLGVTLKASRDAAVNAAMRANS